MIATHDASIDLEHTSADARVVSMGMATSARPMAMCWLLPCSVLLTEGENVLKYIMLRCLVRSVWLLMYMMQRCACAGQKHTHIHTHTLSLYVSFVDGIKCTPDGDVMAAPMQCSVDGR